MGQARARLDRLPRNAAQKFAQRRAELAEAALITLANLGYSRTSLREIAENSNFSHGVLHYYFADKIDLITCSVRLYKARCVTRYDRAITEATGYAALLGAFLDVFGSTLRDEAQLHRLWYDLRSQALYDAAFRSDVLAIDESLEQMIWRVMTRFAELSGVTPAIAPSVAYAIFDGLFQQCLMKYIAGSTDAVAELTASARSILVHIYGAADGAVPPLAEIRPA